MNEFENGFNFTVWKYSWGHPHEQVKRRHFRERVNDDADYIISKSFLRRVLLDSTLQTNQV